MSSSSSALTSLALSASAVTDAAVPEAAYIGAITTKSSSGITSDFLRSVISSAADWYLLSGFFCVHLRTILSMLTGISAATVEGAGISSWICCTATATVESPSKGTVPVNISNIVIPSEYISLLSSEYPPLACSGEI